MKNNFGLKLCKEYYEEIGLPAFKEACPEIIGQAAFGLVGEGSECFGFDDEISRDHDWGPGFCVWLSDELYEKYGEKCKEIYNSLPREYKGYQRLRQMAETAGRVGVMRTSDFYAKYTGLDRAPSTSTQWRLIPGSNFAVATNGEVWDEGDGSFTRIRKQILGFYPEDIRKKKISKAAALAAQSGQYNFYRCQKRGDKIAMLHAKAIFAEHVEAIVYLLNLKFCPYYKWAGMGLAELPVLGKEIHALLEELTEDSLHPGDEIEKISALIIEEFKKQNLSVSHSDFLMDHAREILESAEDEAIRYSHIMAD